MINLINPFYYFNIISNYSKFNQMKASKIILSLALVFIAASCSYRVMDFTLISSKNVELSKFPTYERGSDRIEGEDTKSIIIIIPTGRPDGKEAIDNAIESTPGAVALVDGVLTYKYFYIPYIYGEYTYIIEGTPLIDPALASAEELQKVSDYSVCILDKEGELVKTIEMEEEEYYSFREEALNAPRKTYRKMKN